MNSTHTAVTPAFRAPHMPPQRSQIVGEDSTTALPSSEVSTAWRRILDSHLGDRLRQIDPGAMVYTELPSDAAFEGRAKSGRIGSLEYCHLWMRDGEFTLHCTPCNPAPHVVAITLTGRPIVQAGSQTLRSAPGDFLVLNDLRRLHVRHEGVTEVLLLYSPLDAATRQAIGPVPATIRPGSGDLARVATRWLRDACSAPHLLWSRLNDSVARSLLLLLNEALRVPIPTTREPSSKRRLTRQAIEAQIEHQLHDPTLSVANLAKMFCCCPRTLYRAFRQEGQISLERYIQQRRVHACAERLRTDPASRQTSLTDLALTYGFSSSSHFSTVFRSHMGMSPSAYRAHHHPG